MIRVNKNYVISASKGDYGYAAEYRNGKLDKEGNEVKDILGYAGTVKHCVAIIHRHMVRMQVVDSEIDLPGYIDIIKSVSEELKKSLSSLEEYGPEHTYDDMF